MITLRIYLVSGESIWLRCDDFAIHERTDHHGGQMPPVLEYTTADGTTPLAYLHFGAIAAIVIERDERPQAGEG